MGSLILVKHSQPTIIEGVPPSKWVLSDEGRERCASLAEEIASFEPGIIITSREPKAAETGKIIAEHLGLPVVMGENLHEHVRDNEPFESPALFERKVASFFDHPDELVYGRETAHQARKRFDAAVTKIVAQYAGQNVVVVAHGTVITLFLSWYNDLQPFAFWRQLALPSFVVCSLPDFKIMTSV